ncbi:hypothetical protein BGZ73_004265 [Actinomortierella ambigua]|nr:hypothetical protein BGZ73_004265 [Actinomortierella ambigua]
MTPSGLETIKPHLPKVVSLHKRGDLNAPGNWFGLAATLAAVIVRATESLRIGMYSALMGTTVQQFTNIEEVRRVAQEFYPRRTIEIELVRTQSVPGGFEGNLVTLEMRADGLPKAIVMMDENVNYGPAWIRAAINTSLMERRSVALIRIRDVNAGRYRGYIYITGSNDLPHDLGLQ